MKDRTARLLAACLALLPAMAVGPAAAEPVDLELVLAVDVSWSMDGDELRLQRAGYVAALADPEVLGAIEGGGAYGRIALAYMEWAGPASQVVVVPWAVVGDRAEAAAFAAALAEAPTTRLRGTSISAALATAAGLFDNGFEGLRRAIDVSGDGPNNMGPPVLPVRDAVVAQGIAINGLPVMLNPSGGVRLDDYYRGCVIGGPGAFVLPVQEPGQFAEAIRRKLVLEIAALPPRLVPIAAEIAADAGGDCLVGERLRRAWQEP